MLSAETLRRHLPRYLYARRTAKGHVEDVIATIDLDAFLQLRKTARQHSKTLNALKYFNIEGYMKEQMVRAILLRLNNANKAILDIGTGFGYFPYICEFFGNTATAIDVPDHALFDEVTRFLGVKKVFHTIEPLKPLPRFDRRFDLVTAFQVAFNRYDRGRPWEEQEWSFFLEDLFSNVLNKGGQVALEMNYDPVRCHWLSVGAQRALAQYQARIFGASVRVRSSNS